MKQPKGVAISVVRIHAADALRRARKLPIGQARNELRQLAICLLWLERKGMTARVQDSLAARFSQKGQLAEVGRLSWRPLVFEARTEAPRALTHAAGHEAPNFRTRRIGPANGHVGPNHSSASAVWLGDYGIVGDINPSALETDAVVAILRLPINITDNKAVRERTT
jgi:hypothetical protein